MNKNMITKAGSCLIAASGFFVPAVALAQSDIAGPRDKEDDDVVILAPSEDWSVTRKSDRCRLARKFGSGEDEISLRLEKGGADSTFNLTLFGKPVGNPYGNIVSIRFGPGQDAFGREYVSAKSSKGRPVLMLYGASYTATTENEGGGYSVLRPNSEEFAKMRYLQIGRAGLTPFRMDFKGSLSEVSDKLEECTRTLEAELQAAATGRSRAAQPASNPGEWVLPKDYPRMMVRHNKEGLVQLRLTVSRTGKPTFCAIERTTLPQMFDDAVCLALLKNASFTPSLDREGNPIVSYWRKSVRFQIP